MLQPDKYMNLKFSVLYVCSVIVRHLKSLRRLKYDDLYTKTCKSLNEENVNDVFLLSLTFLYALGKIEYNEQDDTLEMLI